MRFLILLVVAFSSCALQAGKQTNAKANYNTVIPSGRAFEEQFLKKVNKVRASGCKCGKTWMPPAEPLKWNSKLEQAALNHARDLNRGKYLQHTNSEGATIKQRIEAAGYQLTGSSAYAYGENIASGQRSIDRVMESWIKSEGHCKNLMNRTFKEIGVAQVNYYWVQDFAMNKPSESFSR